MAVGQTNISLSAIRTLLGESSYSLFTLGTSNNINKWSKYKPIRDTGSGLNWPAGSNSKYGLNLPTNWDYLKPRGGSPTGVPYDEPVRLGDFRGYEHNRDTAGPVIWCLSSNASVPASITPNITGNGCVANFIANMNTSADNVRITLSDLGYGSYYWGVQVGSYYKTFGTVSNGITLSFDLTLDLSNPANPTFIGFPNPVAIEPGIITWRLFISSSAATSWTTSQPSNYIEFPGNTGETYGSKTIKSNGTFTLTHWIASDESSFGWGADEGTYTYAKQAHIMTSNSNWHIHAIPNGFGIKDGGGSEIGIGSGPFPSGALVNIYATGNNGSTDPILGSFLFHDTDNNECEIEVVQGGNSGSETYPVTTALSEANPNFEAYEYMASADRTYSIITLDLVINCLSGTTLPYTLTKNGNFIRSGIVTVLNNTFCSVTIQGGVDYQTGDEVTVTLDAITPA